MGQKRVKRSGIAEITDEYSKVHINNYLRDTEFDIINIINSQ